MAQPLYTTLFIGKQADGKFRLFGVNNDGAAAVPLSAETFNNSDDANAALISDRQQVFYADRVVRPGPVPFGFPAQIGIPPIFGAPMVPAPALARAGVGLPAGFSQNPTPVQTNQQAIFTRISALDSKNRSKAKQTLVNVYEIRAPAGAAFPANVGQYALTIDNVPFGTQTTQAFALEAAERADQTYNGIVPIASPFQGYGPGPRRGPFPPGAPGFFFG